MRILFAFLIIALAGIQYKLWLGDGGIRHWQQLEEKIEVKAAENKKLTVRNTALEADIVELKSGEQALEEQARYELGMVKEGEVYYQFIE